MTFVLAVTSDESVWIVADRRLTYANGSYRDDAVKTMALDCVDASVILTYAGLGKTASGTEISDWMSAVFRGRNMPLENLLAVLTEALKREVPPHLLRMSQGGPAMHSILVAGFDRGDPCVYSIDVQFTLAVPNGMYRYNRWVTSEHDVRKRPPMFAMAGSGALALYGRTNWQRRIKQLMQAHHRGKIPALTVANSLAHLNQDVHDSVRDKSVSDKCIVKWIYRGRGRFEGVGGAHQFYSGTERDLATPTVPTVANGIDVHALVKVLGKHWSNAYSKFDVGLTEAPTMDNESLSADVARIPDTPDETLR